MKGLGPDVQFWKEDGGAVQRSFLGHVEAVSDETATQLVCNSLVSYPT